MIYHIDLPKTHHITAPTSPHLIRPQASLPHHVYCSYTRYDGMKRLRPVVCTTSAYAAPTLPHIRIIPAAAVARTKGPAPPPTRARVSAGSRSGVLVFYRPIDGEHGLRTRVGSLAPQPVWDSLVRVCAAHHVCVPSVAQLIQVLEPPKFQIPGTKILFIANSAQEN